LKFHELFPDFYRDNEKEWYEFIKEILSPEFDIALEEIEALWSLIDIDSIPEEKLPLLAGNLGFEFAEILPASYRKQLANAIDLHKFKGTKYAVQKALESVGVSGEIKEWFEYDGEPYRFKVDLGIQDREITPELRNKLLQLINEYKNERSWLEEILLSYLATATIPFAATQTAEIESYAKCQTELEWFASGSIPVAISVVAETEATAVMEA
jgi:phage tail P2-like protein